METNTLSKSNKLLGTKMECDKLKKSQGLLFPEKLKAFSFLSHSQKLENHLLHSSILTTNLELENALLTKQSLKNNLLSPLTQTRFISSQDYKWGQLKHPLLEDEPLQRKRLHLENCTVKKSNPFIENKKILLLKKKNLHDIKKEKRLKSESYLTDKKLYEVTETSLKIDNHDIIENSLNVSEEKILPQYSFNIEVEQSFESLNFSNFIEGENIYKLKKEKDQDRINAKIQLVHNVSSSLIAVGNMKLPSDLVREKIVESGKFVIADDPEFILKVALYTRNELNIRITANLLLAFAAYQKECRPYFRKYFNHIIRLPSDWIEVAVLYQTFSEKKVPLGTFPAVLRKAMIDKFPEFDAYQLAKYNKVKKKKKTLSENQSTMEKKKINFADYSDNTKTYADCLKEESDFNDEEFDYEKQSFTLKTLIRRLHITRPAENVMALIGKKYPQDLMTFYRSGLVGIWDEEKAGQRMKLPTPETWETQISLHGNKAKIWEQLIDNKKLPFMAMLRNIRNLILQGVSKDHHKKVLNILKNERSVAQSRQFPFRFFSAFEALNSLQLILDEAEMVVEICPFNKEPWWERRKRKKKFDAGILEDYRTALNESIRLATVHNVATIKGNTIILCDVHWDLDINCKSAKGLGKPRSIIEMGILLGLMCQHICEHSEFVLFGSEKKEFIKHSKEPMLSKLSDLLLTVKHSGINDNSNPNVKFPVGFLNNKLKDHIKVDNLILLSSSKEFPFLHEFLTFYRLFVNSDLLFVKIDLSASKCSVLNLSDSFSSHPNDVLLSGFSEQLLRFIADRGTISQVKYIENIDVKYNIQSQQMLTNVMETISDFHHAQPPPKWHSVKIFISSTFRDMHAERDLLVRYIFPELRRAARSLSVDIHEVDLRWGITEQETLDNKTVEICLRESRKSDIFIGILGDRYGNIPNFAQIPDDDEFNWVKSCPSGSSITELEFYGGAMSTPDTRKDCSLFCFRDNSFLKEVPEKYKTNFVAETEYNQERVIALKQNVIKSGFKVFNGYPCTWGGVVKNNPVVEGLDTMGDWLLKHIWMILLQMFPTMNLGITEKTDFSSESKKHSMFVAQQIEIFVMRKHLLEKCQKSIKEKESNLIIISGKSGSGKTSLMAYLTRYLQNLTSFVFIHFVDASTNANSMMQMIQRFCVEIANQLELKFNVTSDYHDLISQFSNLLENLKNTNKVIFFLIDGLNEMTCDPSLSWLPQDIPKNILMIFSVNTDCDLLKHLLNRQAEVININSLVFSERVQIVNSILKPHRKCLSSTLLSNQVNLLASKREAGLPLYLALACNEIRINAVFDQLNETLINLPSTISELIRTKLDEFCEEYGYHETCLAVGLLATVKNGLTEEDIYLLMCLDYDQRFPENEIPVCGTLKSHKMYKIPRIIFAKLFADITEILQLKIHCSSSYLNFTHNDLIIEAWNYCKKKWIENEDKYLHFLLKTFYNEKADPLNNRTWMGNYTEAFSCLVHYNLVSGDTSEAIALLTDIRFLYAKANHGLVGELIKDFTDVEHALCYHENNYEQLYQYKKFVMRNEHLMTVSPSLILQQAVNYDDNSYPTKDALEFLKASSSNSIVHCLNKSEIHVCLKKKVYNQAITCIEANKKLFALGTESGMIIILNAETYKEKHIIQAHCKSITSLCLIGTQKLCSASCDSTLSLWDLESGSRLYIMKGHMATVTGCCCSSDGKLLVSVSLDCSIRTWNIYSGQEITLINKEKEPINCITFHPNLSLIAIGMWNSTVRIWDLDAVKRKLILKGHKASVTSVAYSSCGDYIASGSLDGKIHLWSSLHGCVILKFAAHPTKINKLIFSSYETLISVGDDFSVKKWSSLFNKTNEIDYKIKGNKITAMAAWEQYLFLAMGANQSDIKKIEISTGCEIFSVCHIQSHATSLIVCENFLCIGFYNGVVSTLNKENGSLLHQWKYHDSAISFLLQFSEKLIISGSVDGVLNTHSQQTNHPINIKAHTTDVTCIAAHLWKPYLASVGKDKVIKIWQVNGDSLKLTGLRDSFHKDWISCCCWNGSIDMLMTGSSDSYIKLWKIKKEFTFIEECITFESLLPSVDRLLNLTSSHLLAGSSNGTFSVFTYKGKAVLTTSTSKISLSCQIIINSTSDIEDCFNWSEEVEQEESTTKSQLWPSVDWVAVTDNEKLITLSLFPDAQEERLSGHSKPVFNVCKFDENYIATCSQDCSICLFDPNTKRKPQIAHKTGITSMVWCPENVHFLTGSRDGHLVLWKWLKNTSLPKIFSSHEAHGKSVNCICFTSTNLNFATASNDCLIKFWRIQANSLEKTDKLKVKVPVICMDYLKSRDIIVAGGWWGKIWICSVTKPAILCEHVLQVTNWVLQVKFCPFESEKIQAFDSSGNIFIASFMDKNSNEYKLIYKEPTNYNQTGESIRSISDFSAVSKNNIQCFASSPLGFIIKLTTDQDFSTSSTLYKLYNTTVFASEYNNYLNVLITSSEDSLLKIWKIKEDDTKQIGQFECSSPVTKIKVVQNTKNSSQPLIVCGDLQGNIYFLQWF